MKRIEIIDREHKHRIEVSTLPESSCYLPKIKDSYFVIKPNDIEEFEYTQDTTDFHFIRLQNSFSSYEEADKEERKRLFITRVREFAYGRNQIKDWFPETGEESYQLILPPVVVYFKNLADKKECLDYFEDEHIKLFDTKK